MKTTTHPTTSASTNTAAPQGERGPKMNGAAILVEALEREGAQSAVYRSANLRATIYGIGVMVPILAILFLMVTKPNL